MQGVRRAVGEAGRTADDGHRLDQQTLQEWNSVLQALANQDSAVPDLTGLQAALQHKQLCAPSLID